MNDLEPGLHAADPMRRLVLHALPDDAVAAHAHQIIAYADGDGPAPARLGTAPARRLTGRRRVQLAVAAVAALVPLGGLGVAGAAGVLPQRFLDALNIQRDEGVDLSTAALGGSLPGPAGQRFEAWTTRGSNGVTCLSTWLVPGSSTPGQPPDRLSGGAGACSRGGGPKSSWLQSGGVSGGNGIYVYIYNAGPASTATLALADGTSMPALIVQGRVTGWFPAPASSTPPVLTAYTNDGTTVGRIAVPVPTGRPS